MYTVRTSVARRWSIMHLMTLGHLDNDPRELNCYSNIVGQFFLAISFYCLNNHSFYFPLVDSFSATTLVVDKYLTSFKVITGHNFILQQVTVI